MDGKKKILIVNNNLQLGGIQKALISMLKSMPPEYDITLLLFQKAGDLLTQIPSTVRVIEEKSRFRYLGVSQAECRQKLRRGVLAFITRKFGFKHAVPFLRKGQKRKLLAEHFDIAVSYQHCAAPKSFYGGTAEYVLFRVDAAEKICFIHCDYANSGTRSAYSESIYRKFDKIALVSASVKERFVQCLPDMEEKCVVAPNAIIEQEILDAAATDTYMYDKNFINLLTVARLSPEKGIERVLQSMPQLPANVRYHLVGAGPQRAKLESFVAEYGLQDRVIFHGATDNPYRYMKNADALVVPSYHEAAPVVFQEAKVLSLPILTTNTTSAWEMVGNTHGIVCENNNVAILHMLQQFVAQTSEIKKTCVDEKNNEERRAFLLGIKTLFGDGSNK